MSKMNSAISGAAAGASIGGPWGAAIGGVGGFLLGSDDKSSSMYDEMLKAAQNIPLPVLKQYYPELYQSVVQMNPELETAVNLGPSEMDGIATDPALRQNQLNALNRLKAIGDAGGRDSQFMSEYGQLENDINTNLQGQQGAIQQNLATRGLSGGGSELVAKNIAAQGAANRHAQSGMDLKAAADKRALQALMQTGELSGQLQAQDFSQQSAKAQAADSIARFNAQNQQQVMSNNVGSRNQAQQYNLGNRQDAANRNTAGANQAQQYNLNLTQQNYDNQMKKMGLYNGVSGEAAKNSANQAANQDQFVGGLASAAGQWAANNKQPAGSNWAGNTSDNWAYDPNKRKV